MRRSLLPMDRNAGHRRTGAASCGGPGANRRSPPRTPDGKPNLAGIYSFSTITPLQRPDALAGKATLSDEEAAAFEASENTRLNRDLFDPIKGQPSAGYAPQGRGRRAVLQRVLVRARQPADQGQAHVPHRRSAEREDSVHRGRAAPERRDGRSCRTPASATRTRTGRLADRCLMGFNSGPPMIPGAYNNNVQIVQTPGYVVIVNEMVHNARIIPTDGRPHTHASPVVGRLTRPLGRRHARRRDDQLPPRDEPAGLDGGYAAGRTLHANRRRHASSTNSPSPIRIRTRSRGAPCCRCRESRSRSSSTPATRATTPCRTFSPARAPRRRPAANAAAWARQSAGRLERLAQTVVRVGASRIGRDRLLKGVPRLIRPGQREQQPAGSQVGRGSPGRSAAAASSSSRACCSSRTSASATAKLRRRSALSGHPSTAVR